MNDIWEPAETLRLIRYDILAWNIAYLIHTVLRVNFPSLRSSEFDPPDLRTFQLTICSRKKLFESKKLAKPNVCVNLAYP